jgi:GAF domain-containing protein
MGLGVRLLEHLMKLIGADFAAICTTTDTELVIEAAHGAGSVGAKPGDRFKLRPGYFVSESVKTREPIAITRTEVASELAHQLRSTLGHIRHGLSVPLVEDGRVQGAIVLFRAAGRPFTKDDVALVEALSSVALLAVGRTWPTRLP